MSKLELESENEKQIFISYCSKNKVIVHRVADELEKLDYKIWIDRNINAGSDLYKEIANGLENSYLFICFVSREYCESKICIKELSLAHKTDKVILPIMIDRKPTNAVELLVADLLRFNAYKDGDKFDPWSQNLFEKLLNTINEVLILRRNPSKSLESKEEKSQVENDKKGVEMIFEVTAKKIFESKSISLFQPVKSITTWHPRHEGFMRLNEMGTSNCILGDSCFSENLIHIMKNHANKTTLDNFNSYSASKSHLIGFHAVPPNVAILIAQHGFRLGSRGMWGGGIYFARSLFQETTSGIAVICAIVNIGKSLIPNGSDPSLDLRKLHLLGFDSVYKNNEFVVYEAERVEKWLIGFPSDYVEIDDF